MKGDLQKYIIYTLSDPITMEIRYVGITTRSLEDRLYGHASDKCSPNKFMWIVELKNNGLHPIIEELECFYDNYMKQYNNEIENYWISQFNTWGFNLFNGNPIFSKCRNI